MVDKLIGDAMMAVFGAPISRKDDAERAVMAALEMRRALKKYNRYREAQGQPPIEIGIGITKGEAITGNIGSERRMDYTVIGDTVNVAARLEGMTKNYECKILINEPVYQDVKHKIACVDLGHAQIKGKGGAIHIYGVLEPSESRVYERFNKHFEVCYGHGDHLVTAQAIEISEGGMSFRHTTEHDLGSEIDVHCKFGKEWVPFRVRVRRCDANGMGVEFLAMGPKERVKLQ